MSWIECPAANFCPPCTSPSSPSKWVGLAWAGREGARPLYKGQVFLPWEEEEDRIYRTTYRRPNVRGEGAVSVSVAIGGFVIPRQLRLGRRRQNLEDQVWGPLTSCKGPTAQFHFSLAQEAKKTQSIPTQSLNLTYRARETRAPHPLLQPSKQRICALGSERIHQLFSR